MIRKKAMILYYLVIPGFIAALLFFLILVYTTPHVQSSSFTGEPALALLSAAQEADRMLFYVDKAAPIATYEAVTQVATNGGFVEASACGSYLGYNLWSEKCIPDMQDTLEAAFNKKMKFFLANYPGQHEFRPLSLNSKFSLSPDMDVEESDTSYYKLFTKDTTVVGSRSQPIRVGISFQNATHRLQVGAYAALPNVHVNTTYNFDHLKTVQGFVTLLIRGPPGLNRLAHRQLSVQPGGCTPTNEKELFYDVMEKIQWCAVAEEEACTCDLAQTDLRLLGDRYKIEFTNDNGVVAYLKDKTKEGSEGEIVDTYHFEEPFEVGRMHAEAELRPLVLGVSTATLEWKKAPSTLLGSLLDSSPKTNMFSWVGDGSASDQPISIDKGLLHERKEGTTKVGLAIDLQRPNPSDPYNQLPKCAPAPKKFRMCIDEGQVNNKPLQFKVAIETS